MKNMFGFVFVAVAGMLMSAVCFAASPPGWAYGFESATGGAPQPGPAPLSPDPSIKHIEGSTLEFTRAQISNGFGPADWFPGDHPTMPNIVKYGKQPDVRACSLCHYPNGKGRAENAGVSGLPVAYFMQQMTDFREGNRQSSEARKGNTKIMIAIAKGMSNGEIKQAAEYFGSMKWTPWIKVIESATVPKTRIQNGLYLKLEGHETEPIGRRIIEVPLNAEETEVLRNPRSGFEAFVPVGSVKKGEALAKTKQCAVCHGPGLKGLGPVPSLAGRSPSYLVRQMYDMQAGARKGLWTDLMKPVVADMSDEDLLVIGAYAASLAP
jgi:cytochrome c553